MSVVDGGGKESSSEGCEAVASTGGDLGEDGVSSELADEAADALATAAGIEGVCRGRGPQLALEVAVGETADEVCAGEDGLEELGVGARDGVEAGVVPAVVEVGATKRVELGDGGAGWGDVGQGVEIAAIGGLADLDVAPEVMDAFVHGFPEAVTASSAIVLEA